MRYDAYDDYAYDDRRYCAGSNGAEGTGGCHGEIVRSGAERVVTMAESDVVCKRGGPMFYRNLPGICLRLGAARLKLD